MPPHPGARDITCARESVTSVTGAQALDIAEEKALHLTQHSVTSVTALKTKEKPPSLTPKALICLQARAECLPSALGAGETGKAGLRLARGAGTITA